MKTGTALPMKNYIQIYFLSEKSKDIIQQITLGFALMGFLVHLGLIELVHFGIINSTYTEGLLNNPIGAIYTPFSFILFYEVYLLIYYLPKSFSKYIGKQYEIITLIIIRRVFKDLSKLELTTDFFKRKNDVNFLYDLLAVLILFALIITFYSLAKPTVQAAPNTEGPDPKLTRFIKIKLLISSLLILVFLFMSIQSFTTWVSITFSRGTEITVANDDLNKIFFDNFFTILILIDVLLLLLTFTLFDKFSVVMRNSGFAISTILIKISFGTTGIVNNLLIVTALVFGVSIFYLHNRFLAMDVPIKNNEPSEPKLIYGIK
ncbi:MAG: hypothetical protein LH478_03805 [Chitinophagaceae bacterium]|nr:hypothetical protein [Chitinophagaceae bacterium]